MKTLLFSGSNSDTSINEQVIKNIYKYHQEDCAYFDIKEIDVPIFKEQNKHNMPSDIIAFVNLLKEHDKFIISTPEYNGNPTPFFKNIFDWCSIHDRDFLKGKKCIVISASPGARGGAGSNKVISTMFGFFGVEVLDNITIGLFEEKYQDGNIVNEELLNEMIEKLPKLLK